MAKLNGVSWPRVYIFTSILGCLNNLSPSHLAIAAQCFTLFYSEFATHYGKFKIFVSQRERENKRKIEKRENH